MALFGNLGSSDNNAHWVTSPNNSRENAVGGSSTSPIRSGPPGFDPTVARPSSGSSASSDASSPSQPSQFGFLNTPRYQPPTGAGAPPLSREDQFHCKVCRVDLSGLEPAKQHYAGKQHRKALSAQDAGQNPGAGSTLPLECKVCQKVFTGPASARQHYDSIKHKTAVEGAAVWAQSQGRAGTVSEGAMKHRSPPGITALGPVAKEAPNIPTSSRAGQHILSGVESNDATPDGVLGQRQHQRSTTIAPSNQGAAGGGLQQPIINTSAEGFTAKIGPGNQLLRQHIAKVCSSVLERYLMQLIPDLTDRITDKVLEELSKTPPIDVSSRETGARARAGQNASAEDLLQSDSSHFQSTTSLIESCTMSLNTLDMRGGLPRSPAMSLNTMDMRGAGKSSAASHTPPYDDVWNVLKGKNN